MVHLLCVLTFLLGVVSFDRALAEDELDGRTLETAIKGTQDVLTDPKARQDAARGNPQAGAVLEQIKSLTGSKANEAELYQIAADVMRSLAQRTGGNPDKMVQELLNAHQNPAAFGETFSPEQKKAIEQLAGKITATNPSLNSGGGPKP
jgi:hypothetical protein